MQRDSRKKTKKQVKKTYPDDGRVETSCRLQPDGTGDYTVRPDGTVYLGVYGSVTVAGYDHEPSGGCNPRSIGQANEYLILAAVDPERYSACCLMSAQYNSKKYYVITDGGGYGEQIYQRSPISGNECCSRMPWPMFNGLAPAVASKREHLGRSSEHRTSVRSEQILPVDYVGLTQHGVTLTNYQTIARRSCLREGSTAS